MKDSESDTFAKNNYIFCLVMNCIIKIMALVCLLDKIRYCTIRFIRRMIVEVVCFLGYVHKICGKSTSFYGYNHKNLTNVSVQKIQSLDDKHAIYITNPLPERVCGILYYCIQL